MRNPSIKIGITLGDPSGVGPEVALKAINELSLNRFIPIIIGRAEVLQKKYSHLLNNYCIINNLEPTESDIKAQKKYFLNIPSKLPIPTPGKGNPNTGAESITYINKAVELWKSGIIDSLVTGPVNKGNIEKSGCHFTGHTEYIAHLINEKYPYMLMYSEDYRVLLVTTHIPVSEIPKILTPEKLYNTIEIGYKSISALDGGKIKIAIAGLDPHCGDNGAIGSFDNSITQNAVRKAKKRGINIHGPFAADTLFTANKWKEYNLVIAHYHDQGLIPFKALAFETGVNVTLGLSIIRTSPDHGTAYDIAGKDIANYKSMLEAIKLAHKLSTEKRNKKE